MMRKTLAFVVVVALVLLGLLEGASHGYLSAFDASPKDLKLSVRSENSTVIVEWELRGGSIVRALAGKRDAVVLLYPGKIGEGDKQLALADVEDLSVSLDGKSVRDFTTIYYPFYRVVSNGSARVKLTVFAMPIDFPSTVQSGRIKLELAGQHGTCNNITLAVIYFHDTGKGEYRNLVLPLSVHLGEGFPVLPGFGAKLNFTVNAPEMPGFLSSAVNAHYLGSWIDEPRGWLVVKTVNVTVCPPKTS